ncbi:DUF1028 domain-containing protein [Acetobacter nitrogenifigens]|uniref:Fimbrial assembly protein FimA n=1 Tax=Acetobacter nitrogenifigens DSM 23921 = NBRC 105050 TaxID=1120919 RepID=A0A511XB14_9PROT|nr:DUF1028 domain-containing protein [Acetobacter nitrogenifigens]GEN60158.1 hypothetical protein ANI02nite_20420 [Acetobacter nitrogenifigens DSM 23921 = NBRC 105050]
MTFSIVARCERTGQFGVAVVSSSPAVAARCAFARAGVGAVTTQNVTDPRLGPKALDFLAEGLSAADARDQVSAAATYAEFRQVTIVDRNGEGAIWSGGRTLGVNAEALAPNVVSAGNLLANDSVPAAIVAAFGASDPGQELAERILHALEAGLAAGGEAGPVHSAGLQIVEGEAWPLVDLRIDWSEEPVADLRGLWELWRPQMRDYLSRALNPLDAPSYGVPGDE